MSILRKYRKFFFLLFRCLPNIDNSERVRYLKDFKDLEYIHEQARQNLVFVTKKMEVIRLQNNDNKKLDIKDLSDFQRYAEILNSVSCFIERLD